MISLCTTVCVPDTVAAKSKMYPLPAVILVICGAIYPVLAQSAVATNGVPPGVVEILTTAEVVVELTTSVM